MCFHGALAEWKCRLSDIASSHCESDVVYPLPGRQRAKQDGRGRRRHQLPRNFCRLLGLGCPKQAFAKIAALSVPLLSAEFSSHQIDMDNTINMIAVNCWEFKRSLVIKVAKFRRRFPLAWPTNAGQASLLLNQADGLPNLCHHLGKLRVHIETVTESAQQCADPGWDHLAYYDYRRSN